jgi:uncharacterized membrane protein YphA (DoxX/SURF4 family)
MASLSLSGGFGEVAIAISLITGCLVRISSLFGAFHNANIYYSVAIASGGATMNYNRLLVVPPFQSEIVVVA